MTLRTSLVMGLAALALAACATTESSSTTNPAAAAARFDSFEMLGQADFSTYDKVFLASVKPSQDLLDRVDYRPRGPSDRIRPLSARDLDAQVKDLKDTLISALAKKAILVDEPMDGVLTVTVTLTGLEANRPTQADLAANPGLSMESVYRGGAAATITLSENGTMLATAEDSNVSETRLEYTSPSIWGEANRFYNRFSSKVSDLLG